MTPSPLTLARPLAIRLLHAAQLAQPEAIHGWVMAGDDGQPHYFLPGQARPAGAVWARLWSHPTAPAVPAVEQIAEGERVLLISLDIKGVLEMRAWTRQQGALHEIVLLAAG